MHDEYLMDEDINDAQKILPSSVLRVNTQRSLSAWHAVRLGGRQDIPLPVWSHLGRRDAPPSFLTRLVALNAKDASTGSAGSFFFFL